MSGYRKANVGRGIFKGLNIGIDLSDFEVTFAWINRLDQYVNDPTQMLYVVRSIGGQIFADFISEGRESGSKWQALSQTTRQVREERGYNPDGPILQQSGALLKMVQRTMANFPRGRLFMPVNDSNLPYENDGKTWMYTQLTPRQSLTKIQGPKAGHLTGGRLQAGPSAEAGKSYGYLPVRDFFRTVHTNAGQMKFAWSSTILNIFDDWGHDSAVIGRNTVHGGEGWLRRGLTQTMER